MLYREIIEDGFFQDRVREEPEAIPQFDKILEAAKLYLATSRELTECDRVGFGAGGDLYCLRSEEVPAFPRINFFFILDSTSEPHDLVVLHDFLIEQPF